MRKKTIEEILSHIKERSPVLNWPYKFASPQSIACSTAIACGINEMAFISLIQGHIPKGLTADEILSKIDVIDNEKKQIFLNWMHTTPVAKGSNITPNKEDLFFLRHNLIKHFTSFESIDIIMLLGFGENIFPVSKFLKDLFYLYHLFENNSTYNEIQTCINFKENINTTIETFLAVKRLDILPEKRKKIATESILNTIFLKCSNCGKNIKSIKNPPIAEITIYPSRNVIITQEDLEADFNSEIKKLIDEARKTDPKYIEKQVYAKYRLTLCPSCQMKLIRSIENGEIV